MPKIIQILNVDSHGHQVRLSDGSLAIVTHSGEEISVGTEVTDPKATAHGIEVVPIPAKPKNWRAPQSLYESTEQLIANVLSEHVKKAE